MWLTLVLTDHGQTIFCWELKYIASYFSTPCSNFSDDSKLTKAPEVSSRMKEVWLRSMEKG